MVTIQTLRAHAYTRQVIQEGRVLYQKRVVENDTLLYVIDFEQNLAPTPEPGTAFNVVVVLFRPMPWDENACLVIRPSFFSDSIGVEEVEELIRGIYQKLGCIPDPIN